MTRGSTTRPTGCALPGGRDHYRGLALVLYDQRRARRFDLPQVADLFGEPAWDMLLDMFVAAEEGRMMDVKNACIGAYVPVTTGIRLIERLKQVGLVYRTSDPFDRRKSMVALTQPGLAAMRRYLDRVASGNRDGGTHRPCGDVPGGVGDEDGGFA